jgi:hypothetical protein
VKRLKKADVEALLGSYDADPKAALSRALAVVLDRPGDAWAELLAAAPLSDHLRQRLELDDVSAFDELAAALNELRTLP